MQDSKKIVLITGANRGLGYGLVEDILSKNSQKFRIIMTSRDQQKGQESYQKLQQKFPTEQVDFELLDIENIDSIHNMYKVISEKYGKIDVLVNNAGVLVSDGDRNKPDGYQPSLDTAKKTLDINFFGTIQMTEVMLPLLADDGKIIQVGSRAGLLSTQPTSTQQNLSQQGLTKQQILDFGEDFLKQCENSISLDQQRWSFSAYEVSKCLLQTYVRCVCPNLLKPNQSLYVMTPGWVRTDMGTQSAARSIEEGNDTTLYLISEVPFGRDEKLNCKFIADRSIIAW